MPHREELLHRAGGVCEAGEAEERLPLQLLQGGAHPAEGLPQHGPLPQAQQERKISCGIELVFNKKTT